MTDGRSVGRVGTRFRLDIPSEARRRRGVRSAVGLSTMMSRAVRDDCLVCSRLRFRYWFANRYSKSFPDTPGNRAEPVKRIVNGILVKSNLVIRSLLRFTITTIARNFKFSPTTDSIFVQTRNGLEKNFLKIWFFRAKYKPLYFSNSRMRFLFIGVETGQFDFIIHE